MLVQALKQYNMLAQVKGRQRTHFRASELGQCARKIAYSMLGYTETRQVNEGTLDIKSYTADHNTLNTVIDVLPEFTLVRTDIRVQWEEGDIKVKGIEDSRVLTPSGLRIAEYKTMRYPSWKQLERYEDLPVGYRMQLNFYIMASELLGWMIVKARLPYGMHLPLVQCIKEWDGIEFDAELWVETVAKMYSILRHVTFGTLPPHPFERGVTYCLSCPYRKYCLSKDVMFRMVLEKKERTMKVDIQNNQEMMEFVEGYIFHHDTADGIKASMINEMKRLGITEYESNCYNVRLVRNSLIADPDIVDGLVEDGAIPLVEGNAYDLEVKWKTDRDAA